MVVTAVNVKAGLLRSPRSACSRSFPSILCRIARRLPVTRVETETVDPRHSMPGGRSWDGRSYNGTHMAHQVLLIPGAQGALGAHVTRAFLASRAQVIGTSRQIAAADFPLPNFTPMPADLTKAEDANQLAAAIIAQFQRIDRSEESR